MDKKVISIIIVNYHSEKWLDNCILSIIKSKILQPYEIIVVDNNEKHTPQSAFIRRNSFIRYIYSGSNKGFAAGCNTGAKIARGRYLLFLNPDTSVETDTISILYQYLNRHSQVGIVAPLTLNEQGKIYPKQGTQILTPLSALFSISIIEKIFPHNPIAVSYWNNILSKDNPSQVGVVPGSSMMIKKTIFNKIGGFDENYFLFFEETDLCKRVYDIGHTIYIVPQARIKHLWGKSTKKRSDIQQIFLKSRKYYLTKHFKIQGYMTDLIINIGFMHIFVISIVLLSGFLYLYRIAELMMFIGDQGWFYLSARNMITTGEIPLVGITSSHTWLHQGPLWTYITALVFSISHFNPIAPAIFTGLLGIITVLLFLYTSYALFGRMVAIISTLLYVSSPLVTIYARMPYHTAPLPILVILFVLFYYQWIQGRILFFYLLLFVGALLYNFQLATIPFALLVIATIGYGFFKKKEFVDKFLTLPHLLISTLSILIPMIPILIYDIHHGFTQTLVYAGWIPYKILSSVLNLGLSTFQVDIYFRFISDQVQKLIFLPHTVIAYSILIISFIGYIRGYLLFNKKSIRILTLCFLFPFFGFIASQTASEAYIPMLIPQIILIVSIGLYYLYKKGYVYTFVFILTILVIGNISTLLQQDFLMKKNNGYGYFFSERLHAIQKIIDQANGHPYNIYAKGAGSHFLSFTMNYEYLLWYFGNAPSSKKEELSFMITELPDKIKIEKLSSE